MMHSPQVHPPQRGYVGHKAGGGVTVEEGERGGLTIISNLPFRQACLKLFDEAGIGDSNSPLRLLIHFSLEPFRLYND